MPHMGFVILVDTSSKKRRYQKILTENSLNNRMFILYGE